jgi:branched-chain amino acid transport system ATP-binding protein
MMLETRHLTRAFGGLTAVSNLSLSVPAGTIRAIIGPNGAGKTTLFNLITGAVPISSGDILFEGSSIAHQSAVVIARLGISRTFQLTSVFPELTARENVWIGLNRISGTINPFSLSKDTAKNEREADRILEMVGIGYRSNVPARELSYGQQRILDIAMALSTKPRLLLLDEPTAGLGVKETDTMTRLIKSLGATTTILLIEHDIEVVLEGKPEEMAADETVQRVYLGHQAHIKGAVARKAHA